MLSSIGKGTIARPTRVVPPAVLRVGKRSVRWPRYWWGLSKARRGLAREGRRYPYKVLFIAGLPKSGTSWIEAMLGGYQGYNLVAPPEITTFDYKHGGSHRFEMAPDFFSRLGDALCVIKIHAHGSENNVRVLRQAGVPYCILYRDLRDAAVSHVAYVKRTPWHPEYPAYRTLDMHEGLFHFAATLLPEWRSWIESWKRRRDPACSLELTYEQVLSDTDGTMRQVVELFGLPQEPIKEIIRANNFEQVRGTSTFFRKGRAGDWVNHFDTDLKVKFKSIIGEDLVRWGYESDVDW